MPAHHPLISVEEKRIKRNLSSKNSKSKRAEEDRNLISGRISGEKVQRQVTQAKREAEKKEEKMVVIPSGSGLPTSTPNNTKATMIMEVFKHTQTSLVQSQGEAHILISSPPMEDIQPPLQGLLLLPNKPSPLGSKTAAPLLPFLKPLCCWRKMRQILPRSALVLI
jgi:hypothetical protein